MFGLIIFLWKKLYLGPQAGAIQLMGEQGPNFALAFLSRILAGQFRENFPCSYCRSCASKQRDNSG